MQREQAQDGRDFSSSQIRAQPQRMVSLSGLSMMARRSSSGSAPGAKFVAAHSP